MQSEKSYSCISRRVWSNSTHIIKGTKVVDEEQAVEEEAAAVRVERLQKNCIEYYSSKSIGGSRVRKHSRSNSNAID